jgi:hypothetical protein
LLIRSYEEFNIRANVLRNNPNVKKCIGQLDDCEKIIMETSDILKEWVSFQRNWLYLNAIFSR